MENRFICIHGHFYQPPRESAWLEVIEMQDTAFPFHDWNERINFECYAPNASARILGNSGSITDIVNNYAKISFNFGPTLLYWLEREDPITYQAILDADRQSMEYYNGHGSAIAQVHSHLIMPLANQRDKISQVKWGIRDFEYRFQRKPEGIWLAETAVDTETLEVLAEEGLKFTILAPRQAKAIRKIGKEEWTGVHDKSIDTTRPYKINLPSGKSFAVFFYNGDIAQAVAFNGLLNNGKEFAKRFLNSFDHNSGRAQLMHIATDGESYGHHHKHGEMALADCLAYIESQEYASLTNYAEYLDRFPPEYEAQIHENSSWSCVHGVERWRSNCGCHTGGRPDWNQGWREPLRDVLNWLRDSLIPVFEKEANKFLTDPWAARNDFIDVILDRSPESIQLYFAKHAVGILNERERVKALRLLEMQRNAMLMFTSCGWFFDEISGIETNQILQYACRVIYYARQIADLDLEGEFIERLSLAESNLPSYEHGASSYIQNVLPLRVDLTGVGMHYAVSSLFEEHPQELSFFNYIAKSKFFDRREAGMHKLAIGRTTVQSIITNSKKRFSFAVLYLGQQNIIGNISTRMPTHVFDRMTENVTNCFENSDLGEVLRLMQSYFGGERFTIQHLFRDERRKFLNLIMDRYLGKVEENFREIYDNNYQLMNVSLQNGLGVPEAFRTTLKFVLRKDLAANFSGGELNPNELQRLIREFEKWGISMGKSSKLSLLASERLFEELKLIKGTNQDIPQLKKINAVMKELKDLKLKPENWKAQNQYYSIAILIKEEGGRDLTNEWFEEFKTLGNHLNFKSDRIIPTLNEDQLDKTLKDVS